MMEVQFNANVLEMELDQSHTEKVRWQYHQAVFKVNSSGSLRQRMTGEHVEENTGERVGKDEDDLDTNREEGSRLCEEEEEEEREDFY